MSQELLNIFMAVFYITAIVFMVLFVSWLKIQRRKNSEAMRKNIISKFSSEIALTAKDVVHIGKAFDLSAHQARKVIYDIYSEANEKGEFNKLQELIRDIEKEEPFDELPDEVKPSLIRLTKISESSGEESDKHILSPIVQTLNKYVELKSEQEKLKKQTNRAYVITIISFIFGAVSTYFTISAPSATEIAKEIQKKQEVSAEEEHNNRAN